MRKLPVVLILLIVFGCNEANKSQQSPFRPVPLKWAAQFGDSEDSRLAYNIVMLARANAKLNQRVVILESKAIMDGDLIRGVWPLEDPNSIYEPSILSPMFIYKVDPNDPNS